MQSIQKAFQQFKVVNAAASGTEASEAPRRQSSASQLPPPALVPAPSPAPAATPNPARLSQANASDDGVVATYQALVGDCENVSSFD